jgi:hypoxanthine phosphoribosyltransferase
MEIDGVAIPEWEETLLFNIPQIQDMVRSLASSISRNIVSDESCIIIVGIMKGALFLTSDLLKALPFDCDYGFVTANSYKGTKSTTMVAVDAHGLKVKGMTVILVDEICDTGYTLQAVKAKMLGLGAHQVFTCVLLDKPCRREVAMTPDFIGAQIDNHFVIGYGLDSPEGLQRTLPYIYYQKPINNVI